MNYLNKKKGNNIHVIIPTERSEWGNLFRDVSTTLDMTGGLYSS